MSGWIQIIESQGVEVNVTLLVSGCIVTGVLTPILRYHRWVREVVGRALQQRGTFRIPPAEMGPISQEESNEVIAKWKEDYPENPEVDFNAFCLRNAEIQAGAPVNWEKRAYLVVATDHVAAFTIGAPEPAT